MKLDFDIDLWQMLASTDKTVVMYGMGNGADKILAVCEKKGITVSDFFASDGFVRGHSFHGKVVLSYSEIKEKYRGQDIIILLSFATSLPDVLDRIKQIASEHTLLVPDVPVSGENLFDMEFFKQNEDKIDEVYSLFADDESREIYRNIIQYKLSGDPSYLFAAESDKDTVYRELISAESIKSYADLGAYNGDTIREMLQYNPNLESVIAFEPDRRNHRKLTEYANTVPHINVEAYNKGAWREKNTLIFDASGNRNATLMPKDSSSRANTMIVGTLGKKATEIEVDSLDNILGERHVDYIKYDVEGSEREALLGSRKTIATQRPKMLVSLYHRSEDIFELPLLVHSLDGERRLYLRRFRYLPAWDINLYVI